MARTPRIHIPAGSDVAIVDITGNPKNLEPGHVRIIFPGGEMELVRASDGPGAEYWCHVRINSADDAAETDGLLVQGKLADARLDVRGKHASDCDAGDFAHPGLYHLAVRVGRAGGAQ